MFMIILLQLLNQVKYQVLSKIFYDFLIQSIPLFFIIANYLSMINRVLQHTGVSNFHKKSYTLFNSTILSPFCSYKDLRLKLFRTIDDHGINSSRFQQIGTKYSNEMNLLFRSGKIKEGIEYYRVRLDLIERLKGSQHEDYLKGKTNLSVIYTKIGMFAEALEILSEVKKVWEKNFGKQNQEYLKITRQIIYSYNNLGKFQEAKQLLIQTQEIFKKINEIENKPEVVRGFISLKTDLGRLLFQQKNYNESLKKYRQAYNILQEGEKSHKDLRKNQNVKEMLLELVNLQYQYGNKNVASEIIKNIEAGEINQSNIVFIRTLIAIYTKFQMFSQLESLTEKCIDQLPKTYEAEMLLSIIKICMFKNDFRRGEQTCLKILEIFEKNPPKNIIQKIHVVGLLVHFHKEQKNYKQYFNALNKLLELYQEINRTNFRHFQQIKVMEKISSEYFQRGNLQECQKIHLQILKVLDGNQTQIKEFDRNEQQRGKSLLLLHNIALQRNQMDDAFNYSLKIQEEFLKDKYKEDSIVMMIKNRFYIYVHYDGLGEKQKAEEWLHKYRKAVLKYSNKQDLIYAQYLQREALISTSEKDYESAYKGFLKSAEIAEKLIRSIPAATIYVESMRQKAEQCLDLLKKQK